MRRPTFGALGILLLLSAPVWAAPGAPTALNGVVTGSTVNLTWIPADSSVLKEYRLEAGTAPGLSNAAVIVVHQRTYTTTSVPRGTYYVRVRAIDETGAVGPASNEIAVVVDGATKTCERPPVRPNNFNVNVSEETGVAFGWLRPTDECIPKSYICVVGSAPGLSDLATFSLAPGFAFSYDVPPGTYFVRLIAVNEFGQSPESNEVVVVWGCRTPPSAPQALTAAVSNSTLTLSWTKPVIGCNPSAYELQVGTAPGLSNLGTYRLGATPGFVANAPSGTYFMRVVGRNAIGAGAPSNEIRVIVP